MSVALHLEVEHCEFSQSTLACQLVLSLCRPCQGYCILKFHGCNSLPVTGDIFSNCSDPLILTFFQIPFPQCSLSLRCRGCVVNVSVGALHPQTVSSLHFDQSDFYDGLCLLQKETSLMRGESYTYLLILRISIGMQLAIKLI